MNNKIFNDLASMRSLLTDDDVSMLRDIYAPVAVCAHPDDTRTSLCVMPDGEIRSYGKRWNPTAQRFDRIYLASRDCGLSWKAHFDRSAMGSCVRNPHTGRWVKVKTDNTGTYALLSEVGPDDTSPKRVDIDPCEFIDAFPAYSLAERNRLIVTMHSYDGEVQHPVIAYSDDDGESWTVSHLETTPPFEVQPPHLGTRWQNRGAEPTLIESADGRLIMLERTSLNNFYAVFSYDGGNSWSKPLPSRFHATLTTPAWLKLSDGRTLLFWNNSQPLPEQDHDAQFPPADWSCKSGDGEDVFTNRDVSHAAIFDGENITEADILTGGRKSWRGFRELYLNDIRANADFRVIGSLHDSLDKSVHQFQAIELPFGKVMVQFGQNLSARRTVVFDPNWLYEKERSEDFSEGLVNVSTHVYVRSYNGCSSGHGRPGHCAYNRTNGALLVPSPELDHREVLQLAHTSDTRLFSDTQGVAWNFSARYKGKITVRYYIAGGQLRISLCDRWLNPIDLTVAQYAALSFSPESTVNEWHTLTVDFENTAAKIIIDGVEAYTLPIAECDNGISYLHLQNITDAPDYKGILISNMKAE